MAQPWSLTIHTSKSGTAPYDAIAFVRSAGGAHVFRACATASAARVSPFAENAPGAGANAGVKEGNRVLVLLFLLLLLLLLFVP